MVRKWRKNNADQKLPPDNSEPLPNPWDEALMLARTLEEVERVGELSEGPELDALLQSFRRREQG